MNIAHLANSLSTRQILELALSITERSKASFARNADYTNHALKGYFNADAHAIKLKKLERVLLANGIDFSLCIGDQSPLSNQLSAQIILAQAQTFLGKPKIHMAINGVNLRALRSTFNTAKDTSVERLSGILSANSVPFRFTMRFEPANTEVASKTSASEPSQPHRALL